MTLFTRVKIKLPFFLSFSKEIFKVYFFSNVNPTSYLKRSKVLLKTERLEEYKNRAILKDHSSIYDGAFCINS